LVGRANDGVTLVPDTAYLLLNRPSAFSFDAPSNNQNLYVGESFSVVYRGQNPALDDTEQFTLRLVSVANPANFVTLLSTTNTPTGQGAPPSVNTSTAWSNNQPVPPGTYRVEALISVPGYSGIIPNRTVVAPGLITVISNQQPAVTADLMSLNRVVLASGI